MATRPLVSTAKARAVHIRYGHGFWWEFVARNGLSVVAGLSASGSFDCALRAALRMTEPCADVLRTQVSEARSFGEPRGRLWGTRDGGWLESLEEGVEG